MNDNIMNTQWSKKEEEKKPLDRLSILEALLSNKGDRGEKGDVGEKGDTGEKGDKGDCGKDGEKGVSVDMTFVVSEVLSKIPEQKPIEISAERIKQTLRNEPNIIEIETITGLSTKLETFVNNSVNTHVRNTPSSPRIRAKINGVEQNEPVGSINFPTGSTHTGQDYTILASGGSSASYKTDKFLLQTGTTLTLTQIPTYIFNISRNRLTQYLTDDYTLSGTTVTFVTALVADDIYVTYAY